MGIRESEQSSLWVATAELPKSPGHPFYTRLNALLDAHDFDPFVEGLCRGFYAQVMGRPSLAPGRYFRLLLVGYFEGIDSERGIAWRATDSLAVRSFLRLGLEDAPPDHSTISRTRRLIDLETHRAIFTWVQQRLVEAGLLTSGVPRAVRRGVPTGRVLLAATGPPGLGKGSRPRGLFSVSESLSVSGPDGLAGRLESASGPAPASDLGSASRGTRPQNPI